MNQLNWCLNIKNGLEVVEPNDNLCTAYFKKAENALNAAASLKENKEWEVSSRYYAMYFAVYALLVKLGVKCENHVCTIEFMKVCLKDFFSNGDADLLHKAMIARVDVQYYTDRFVDEKTYQNLKANSGLFLVKCKEASKKINQETVKKIRELLYK